MELLYDNINCKCMGICRPHVILAGLAQATAWLVLTAFLLSRRQPRWHARPSLFLWVLLHGQVGQPQACTPADVAAEDITGLTSSSYGTDTS